MLANIYLSDLHSHLELGHSKAPVLSQSSVTSVTLADDLLITPLEKEELQHPFVLLIYMATLNNKFLSSHSKKQDV